MIDFMSGIEMLYKEGFRCGAIKLVESINGVLKKYALPSDKNDFSASYSLNVCHVKPQGATAQNLRPSKNENAITAPKQLCAHARSVNPKLHQTAMLTVDYSVESMPKTEQLNEKW